MNVTPSLSLIHAPSAAGALSKNAATEALFSARTGLPLASSIRTPGLQLASQLPLSADELPAYDSDGAGGGDGGWDEIEEGSSSFQVPPSDKQTENPPCRAVKGGRAAAVGSSGKGPVENQKVSATFVTEPVSHDQPLKHTPPFAQSRQNTPRRVGVKGGRGKRGDDSPSPPKKSHKVEGTTKNSISVKEVRALGLGAIYSTDGLPLSAVKLFRTRFT